MHDDGGGCEKVGNIETNFGSPTEVLTDLSVSKTKE